MKSDTIFFWGAAVAYCGEGVFFFAGKTRLVELRDRFANFAATATRRRNN